MHKYIHIFYTSKLLFPFLNVSKYCANEGNLTWPMAEATKVYPFSCCEQRLAHGNSQTYQRCWKKIKYATASLHKQRQGLIEAHDGEQFEKKKERMTSGCCKAWRKNFSIRYNTKQRASLDLLKKLLTCVCIRWKKKKKSSHVVFHMSGSYSPLIM